MLREQELKTARENLIAASEDSRMSVALGQVSEALIQIKWELHEIRNLLARK